ncbi:hypothetical protein HI914_00290 [Erysiphe necator]|nr:hypothetical protein HI914_00290 [Erysiphe necator]
MKYSLAFTSLRYFIFIIPIFAHTWVETVNLVGSDGSFQNTGFPRGFGARVAGIDPDKTNTYLLPPNGRGAGNEILPTDLICKDTQVNQVQSSGYPRLQASPNDHVSLAYHENGHVTKFDTTEGKPEGRGTVFIYGTKNPTPKDTFLEIHRVWNENGTGGNKRGKLLATRPFDDGQCYQPNAESTAEKRAKSLGFSSAAESPEVLCQTILKLPLDAGSNGTYTIYWVWDWPTLDEAGKIFKNETYTSCIDIDMVGKLAAQPDQSISATKDNDQQGNKACVQNDSNKNANHTIAISKKVSRIKISQEKTVAEKESMRKEFKGEVSVKDVETGNPRISECKANKKNNLIPGSNNGNNLDEGKVFSATGVMTAKNGKDKANTFAVKDQLHGKGQIMVDPKAPPKIASDNPPKNYKPSVTPAKDQKNSTKISTSPKMIDKKLYKEISTTKMDDNLTNKGLPISRIVRGNNYILTGNDSTVD